MNKVTMKYFDVFNFVKKAKEFGVNEQFAEYEARQIEQAINTIANEVKMEIKKELHSDEIVTKSDLKQQLEIVKLELKKEIAQASNKALLLMGTFGIFFLGVLAKGFHWVL